MRKFFNFFIPSAKSADLRRAGLLSLAGAWFAGGFGIIHDQITYTISPEYFTQLKFDQFRAADFGFPRRVFVAEIGFLATWWVGLIAAWFLARMALAKFEAPKWQVFKAMVIMASVTGMVGVCGYLLGPALFGSRAGWSEALKEMGVTDLRRFYQVAGIHLGSYAGALLGWIAMMIRFSLVRQKTVSLQIHK